MPADDDDDEEERWNRCHRPNNNKKRKITGGGGEEDDDGTVPSRLYTDENPATTIKGTGFRDRETAERTIALTSQKGVRYKQYWTIRAMYERAKHHPHRTAGMSEAMGVFSRWMEGHRRRPPLTAGERREREREWMEYRALCASAANRHSYSGEPTQRVRDRARGDLRTAATALRSLLEEARRRQRRPQRPIGFPLTAFTAVFGGPGIHGYGRHDIILPGESRVTIDGTGGLLELVPNRRSIAEVVVGIGGGGGTEPPERITIVYDRLEQKARAELVYAPGRRRRRRATILSLWKNHKTVTAAAAATAAPGDLPPLTQVSADPPVPVPSPPPPSSSGSNDRDDGGGGGASSASSWTCGACTFEHTGTAKESYLSCEVCGTARFRCSRPHRPPPPMKSRKTPARRAGSGEMVGAGVGGSESGGEYRSGSAAGRNTAAAAAVRGSRGGGGGESDCSRERAALAAWLRS